MRRKMMRGGACALVLTLVAGMTLAACTKPDDAAFPYDGVTTVVQAALPNKPAADDYQAQNQVAENNQLNQAFLDEVEDFSYCSASAVLSQDASVNGNYSSTSLFYAMAMTQTGAAGKTRDEIAAALGSTDVDTTTQQCGNLLRLLAADQYSDVKLANSVWMRPDTAFEQSFVDTMRDQFYASLFLADFGTPEADKAMGQWIADNTEGTLTPEFKSEADQLISLINTVYFKSEWSKGFDTALTESGSFASQKGKVQADFMVQRLDTPQEVRATDAYTRASLSFKDGSSMTFVLPAEGVNVQDLVADATALSEAFSGESTGEAFVTYRIPKFGFDSSYDLIPSLRQLGISTAFGDQADFSNLTDVAAYVSAVIQESHIGLDENGVEASAYTKVDIMAMSALPDPSMAQELSLNLNRPFLYEIRSRQGVPLFVGMCGNPSEAM